MCDAWCEQFEIEPLSAASDVFQTVARFSWGDYTAISYVRGSPEETETITINGMPVMVGTNLAAAIDCLRSRPMCKIWVDAVCISQEDVVEAKRARHEDKRNLWPVLRCDRMARRR